MPALVTPFDATQWNPEQGTPQLPVGKHPVVIESSEVKPNKAGNGGYLQLNLRITDGPQAGTSGAYRLNLYNNSQQAVDIAHRQLSAICHVTGVFNVSDSTQLHNIPFMVEVGVQNNDEKYTEVKKVYDAAGNEPKAGAMPSQAQPQGQGGQAQPQNQGGQGGGQGGWGGQAGGQPGGQQGGQPEWGQGNNQGGGNPAPDNNQSGGNAGGGNAPWGNGGGQQGGGWGNNNQGNNNGGGQPGGGNAPWSNN